MKNRVVFSIIRLVENHVVFTIINIVENHVVFTIIRLVENRVIFTIFPLGQGAAKWDLKVFSKNNSMHLCRLKRDSFSMTLFRF